jgi:hypothetical protein
MKRCTIFALAVASLVAAPGVSRGGTTYSYMTLDVPGATSTQAFGISGDVVVGSYEDSQGVTHGFSETGGAYTTLDVPGATSTTANGVDGGTVVGTYTGLYQGVFGYYGFTESGGNYVTLSDPLGTDTYAEGIDGGNVVGIYENGGYYGYIENNGIYTTLNDPSGNGITEPHGISGNTVVGVLAGPNFQGFSETGGVYTALDDVADGSSEVYAAGIDGSTVVGFYNADAADHGFVETDGIYTALEVPGAINTSPYGISGNTIVGSYADDEGNTNGFIAAPVPEPGSLSLLGLGGSSLLVGRRRV